MSSVQTDVDLEPATSSSRTETPLTTAKQPNQTSPTHSAARSGSSASVATPTEFLQTSDLTPDEESLTHEFLHLVNTWRTTRGFGPLQYSNAVKFLMARKFNIDRALALYQQHELMRLRESLISTTIDPDSNPLKDELETGKFTILPSKDANGATLALFNAQKHDPSTVDHRTTLQGVIYQLDVALESIETQRGGLVFIYNMAGSK